MKVLLLGASGNIGTQTRSVILKHHDKYSVTGVSLGSKDIVSTIIKEFPECECIYITSDILKHKYQDKYPNIRFFSELDGIKEMIRATDYEMMVNALSGFFGLLPTLMGLAYNKKIALANKESIVCGADLLRPLLESGKGKIYPIDSEHSAIYRCLACEKENIDKVIITTSGGALRDISDEDMDEVTPKQVLKHPTWKMGDLITAESALMVNKAYEIAEACFLFSLKETDIEVMLDKTSFIHAVVTYKDGHARTYMKKPSMLDPIEFALNQCVSEDPYYDTEIINLAKTNLEPFDEGKYPLFRYYESILREGSEYGTAFNACIESLISTFLAKKIRYMEIPLIIDDIFQNLSKNPVKDLNYDRLVEIDNEVRDHIREVVGW